MNKLKFQKIENRIAPEKEWVPYNAFWYSVLAPSFSQEGYIDISISSPPNVLPFVKLTPKDNTEMVPEKGGNTLPFE